MTATLQTETFSFRWGIPLDDVGHTPVPNWMFDYYAEAGVKQHEFLLILHLARYAYERPGTMCCPSVETLAAQLGITPRALRQRLSDMEDRGLLQRQYRPGQTTVYDFTPFSEQVRRAKLHPTKNHKPSLPEAPLPSLPEAPLPSLPEGLPTEGPQAPLLSLPEGLPTEGPQAPLLSLPEGLPTEGPQRDGDRAEETFRATPEETCPPPRKVSSPKEQQKEQKGKKKTTTRTSNDAGAAPASSGNGNEDAVAFSYSKEEKEHAACRTMPETLPQDLREKAQALGFRGRKNWGLLAQVYDKEPQRVRGWIEALAEGRVEARNPPGLLLIAIRDTYPAPPLPEPAFEPPDPDCDLCLGTGVPLRDGHWQYGEHCRCTWPGGYVPPPQPSAPQRKPPDPDCDICLGTGTPLVGGRWQRGQKCACTKA
jgi:hypothetical protein